MFTKPKANNCFSIILRGEYFNKELQKKKRKKKKKKETVLTSTACINESYLKGHHHGRVLAFFRKTAI